MAVARNLVVRVGADIGDLQSAMNLAGKTVNQAMREVSGAMASVQTKTNLAM